MRRTAAISKRIGASLLRLACIAAGLGIEYREIFVVSKAQWILVFLGLWFMCIPPALWLDSLRRMTSAVSAVNSAISASAPQVEQDDHSDPDEHGKVSVSPPARRESDQVSEAPAPQPEPPKV